LEERSENRNKAITVSALQAQLKALRRWGSCPRPLVPFALIEVISSLEIMTLREERPRRQMSAL